MPLKQAQAFQQWIPGAELIFIEGAGNIPQVERPKVCCIDHGPNAFDDNLGTLRLRGGLST
jgi:hypothetical protein